MSGCWGFVCGDPLMNEADRKGGERSSSLISTDRTIHLIGESRRVVWNNQSAALISRLGKSSVPKN
jgi:hypothetical protein